MPPGATQIERSEFFDWLVLSWQSSIWSFILNYSYWNCHSQSFNCQKPPFLILNLGRTQQGIGDLAYVSLLVILFNILD